jgi:hypothetical protein
MHPKRRFFVRAVVLLALSFTGLIHAQVKTTGKVPALEQLEKVGVYIEAQHHAEHPGLQGYYEDRATEWRRSIIDRPPVRFAREPWEPPSIAFKRSFEGNPEVRSSVRKAPADPERGRRLVEKKMEEIRIEEYQVPQAVELSEVLKNLHTLARKLDPEKRGVNIVLSSIVEDRRFTPIFDVEGKMPGALEDYTVKISSPLRNISLRELLDAIVNAAVPPVGNEGAPGLRYSIEEYGVVFRQRIKDPVELIDAPLKVITAE